MIVMRMADENRVHAVEGAEIGAEKSTKLMIDDGAVRVHRPEGRDDAQPPRMGE